MAGREMPSSTPSWNIDIAISAPVLPAEIATSASLFFTDSMARHMLVLRPRRSARLGFSSMRTRSAAWRIVTRSASLARLASSGFERGLVAVQDESHRRMAKHRARQCGHDDAGAGIAAHRIDRDCQFAGQRRFAS